MTGDDQELIANAEAPGKVLDIGPALRRKRVAACKHPTVSVDDEAASATCDDCGAEIDPWLLLRKIAHHRDAVAARWNEEEASLNAELQAKLAEGNAKLAELNQRIAHHVATVNELIERQNRLWNTPINGRPLGTHRKTRARKQPAQTNKQTTDEEP